MNSFIDAGYHWLETTAVSDSDVRTFQRGLPAPVTQVEAGLVHALAAHFDKRGEVEADARVASAWMFAADELRELLKP